MSPSHNDTDMYAASCNPSRRAKRLRSDSTPESAQLPSEPLSAALSPPQTPTKRSQVCGTSTVDSPSGLDVSSSPVVIATPPPPQKRGRKSGLPRAAREAQRKLNHSMIEKARRTKINDALAALRAMVPVDYASLAREDDEDDDRDKERDGEESAVAKDKGRPKEKGKKEEKEKEFKLEILVRAVSFMQDLLVKVRDMEAAGNNTCPNCHGPSSGMKRKRSNKFVDTSEFEPDICGDGSEPPMQEDFNMTTESNIHRDVDTVPVAPCRLPSISSWLPHSYVDPSYLPPSSPPRSDKISYLPSPPSSTQSRPVSTARLPPKLALDVPSTSHTLTPTINSGSSPQVSPEDESAASLLLQISISSPSWSPSIPTSPWTNAPALDLGHSQSLGLRRRPSETPVIRQAQTPSSLLGMGGVRMKA